MSYLDLNTYHQNVIAEYSAEKKMTRYINASVPIIEYIDKLYLSRNIVLDWWVFIAPHFKEDWSHDSCLAKNKRI